MESVESEKMPPIDKVDDKSGSGYSALLHLLSGDAFKLLKIIAPILLLIAFVTVLKGWFELSNSENLSEQISDALKVPLMLFGVTAIINVMIFREASSSTFLAVFFIGTVIAGPEMAEKALRASTGTAASVYENSSGGVGYVPYSNSGGLLPEEKTSTEEKKSTEESAVKDTEPK